MSKQRVLKDEIWDDEWFYDLDPVEKLVWIFLLSNNRCNIAGVYKLNQKWGARMTGIDPDMFTKIIDRFVKEDKVFLHDEWLVIVNFTKHQAQNPSVKQGISRILQTVPQEVIDSLRQTVPACPTLLYFTLLNSTLPNGDEGGDDESKKQENILIGEVIKHFESVDIKNKTYYGNKTQRGAAAFLIEQYTFDEVVKRIGFLSKTNKMPYFPTITTPVQMRDKWVNLEDALIKHKSKNGGNVAF